MCFVANIEEEQEKGHNLKTLGTFIYRITSIGRLCAFKRN